VLTIWEGTTNVLCLDFLRAISSNSDKMMYVNCYARMISSILANFYTSRSKLVPKNILFTNDIAKITNNNNGVMAELSKIVNGK
jgi:hypothetical protein